MNTEAILATNLLPLIIYFGAVVAITGVMLGGAYFLGQRHHTKAADEPFESGIIPTGDVHIRFFVHFYLPAIFFIWKACFCLPGQWHFKKPAGSVLPKP